jgi:hypothetical protein
MLVWTCTQRSGEGLFRCALDHPLLVFQRFVGCCRADRKCIVYQPLAARFRIVPHLEKLARREKEGPAHAKAARDIG